MKLGLDSLYLRLALVLAAALIAGFVTMGWLFHHHMELDRSRGERHSMVGEIKLAESLLRQSPTADVEALTGLPLVRAPVPVATEPGPPPDLPSDIGLSVGKELGHAVELRHPSGAFSGLWVRMDVPELPVPAWIFLAPPDPFEGPPGPPGPPRGPRHGPRPRIEPWIWGLLVSFTVVFVGGIGLLWRVQVPLRKLEKALRQLGPAAETPHLEVAGPREVRGLARQFNAMTARLQQYEQDRQEMLAGVAHDLRAPVTRLRLQLELEDSPRKAAMVRNLDSVEAIVDQFLLFARGGDGEAAVELDLAAFLAEVAAPYEDQGVVCKLPELDVILSIQPSSLRRALCNLIENALEYGAPPVTVALRQDAESIVLAVADRGRGIAPADRALAQRPFTRLDDARASQGHCGLGLAIVARIAAAQGARLELDNVADGGFEARIVFPRSAVL